MRQQHCHNRHLPPAGQCATLLEIFVALLSKIWQNLPCHLHHFHFQVLAMPLHCQPHHTHHHLARGQLRQVCRLCQHCRTRLLGNAPWATFRLCLMCHST